MDRRSFLAVAGGVGAAAVTGAGFLKWQELSPTLHMPGMDEGHYLRDLQRKGGALPAPARVLETDVAILGSGIAGLAAAWQLKKLGHTDALMVDGPEAFGNAAGGRHGELAYPTGAHYLPLPSMESTHVRAILADLGIIVRDALAERPTYDERFLLHGPEERLLVRGAWHEGPLPPVANAAEAAEHQRFFAAMEVLRQTVGGDGRRAFALPSALSSQDPVFLALDKTSMKDWMAQQGYGSDSLHWYVNYCCRDDYGSRYDSVSAWAGLHYFCSRGGQAANAADGAWLTWPGGLQPVAEGMARIAGVRRHAGSVASVRRTATGVETLCFTLKDGVAQTFLVRSRKAICAMPLFVAARVVDDMASFGFDVKAHVPPYAPWMVANFLMSDFPAELPEAPLAWDNVVASEPGLGYVVSTHQDIRRAPPAKTVFSAYVALSHRSAQEARRWMHGATPAQLVELAAADLKAAYGWKFAAHVEQVDITLRGHAMAVPTPGFRSNAGLQALREADGPIVFAHADLSGFSVFEEAAWWGCEAARRVIG